MKDLAWLAALTSALSVVGHRSSAIGPDQLVVVHHHGLAQDILQLADIAGPVVFTGGALRIGQAAGEMLRWSFSHLMLFIAFFSINLFLLNLMPIPVLDGGHLVFLTIEGIRRRPLSDWAMETSQKVGIFLLMALMVFVFYNDILRLVQRWMGS